MGYFAQHHTHINVFPEVFNYTFTQKLVPMRLILLPHRHVKVPNVDSCAVEYAKVWKSLPVTAHLAPLPCQSF
jgi:hypothetical protein